MHSRQVSVEKGVLRVTIDMKIPVLMEAPQAPIYPHAPPGTCCPRFTISSSADGTEFATAVPYDGRYGEFRYCPVVFNGERLRISVDRTGGISNNCQLAYLRAQAVRANLEENIPALRVVPSQATYLLWLDCSAFTSDSKALAADIRRKTGLFLSDGLQYGESGRCFLRMNIACPRTLLLDGLDRLKKALS